MILMSLVRQPLLEPEVEAQLKGELSYFWLNGKSGKKMLGKEIAKELKFGIEGSLYEKVKPHYVYYYRQKFAKNNPELFPLRKKPAFAKKTLSACKSLRKSRYKVHPEEIGIIEPEEFIEKLNEKLYQESFYSRRARSFLIILFYTPLRSSEVYERTIDNFEITKSKITIHLLRKKKEHQPDDKDEPINIPRILPLVEEVVDWLKGEEWKIKKLNKKGKVVFNLRPWKMGYSTARNYVKEVWKDAYPHYFRFRWLTNEANYPETTLPELKSKSRLSISALDKYVLAPKVVERKLDKRIVKRFKDKGLIK